MIVVAEEDELKQKIWGHVVMQVVSNGIYKR